jgi:hypothetical protein
VTVCNGTAYRHVYWRWRIRWRCQGVSTGTFFQKKSTGFINITSLLFSVALHRFWRKDSIVEQSWLCAFSTQQYMSVGLRFYDVSCNWHYCWMTTSSRTFYQTAPCFNKVMTGTVTSTIFGRWPCWQSPACGPPNEGRKEGRGRR